MESEGRPEAETAEVIRSLVSLSFEALPAPERAMAEYTLQLTREPAGITRGDTELLRARGFGDRAIHDICAICAYFAFVNRISDGLGVDLEERFGPE